MGNGEDTFILNVVNENGIVKEYKMEERVTVASGSSVQVNYSMEMRTDVESSEYRVVSIEVWSQGAQENATPNDWISYQNVDMLVRVTGQPPLGTILLLVSVLSIAILVIVVIFRLRKQVE